MPKLILSVVAGRSELLFENAGPAVPDAVAQKLFKELVPAGDSGKGMGIGMFQVGRLAAQSGYRAELASNVDGRVAFRLFPA